MAGPSEGEVAAEGSAEVVAPPRLGQPKEDARARAALVNRALLLSRQLLMQETLTDVVRVLAAAVCEITASQRAYSWFVDSDSKELWCASSQGETPRAGLVDLVATQKTGIVVAGAKAHPAYQASSDDPVGTGNESLLLLPVVKGNGDLQAVLVAVRDPGKPRFTPDDVQKLGFFAEHAGYALHCLTMLERTRDVLSGGNQGLFRREALETRAELPLRGDVVRVLPRWLPWAYGAMLALLVLGAALLVFGELSRYSEGPVVAVGKGALNPGDAPKLFAFLPARDAAELRAGMPVRIVLPGRDALTAELRPSNVPIVGPMEARRLLGDRLAELVPLQGPMVVAEVWLPDLSVPDGLVGGARVRMTTEPIIKALFPQWGAR